MSITRRQLLVGLGILATALGSGVIGKFAVNGEDKSSETLLRFISVADTGTGDDGQYAVAKAMYNYYQQKPYPLALLAGDNIYNSGEISKVKAVFDEPYAPLLKAGVKFRAVLGNHDVVTNNGMDEVKYPLFNMTDRIYPQGNRYYTFQEGKVQFFAIDTNTDDPQQLAWLDKSLGESKALWKIVFGHHPIYSSGLHGSTEALINTLPPLFAKHNVQLYLCGHDHDYERSRVMNGTTYIVEGAGANTRWMYTSDFTAYSASRPSFVALEVTSKQILTEAIGTDGEVFDRSVIPLKSF